MATRSGFSLFIQIRLLRSDGHPASCPESLAGPCQSKQTGNCFRPPQSNSLTDVARSSSSCSDESSRPSSCASPLTTQQAIETFLYRRARPENTLTDHHGRRKFLSLPIVVKGICLVHLSSASLRFFFCLWSLIGWGIIKYKSLG